MQPIHMKAAEAVRAHRDLGAKAEHRHAFRDIPPSTPEAIHQPQAELKAALDPSGDARPGNLSTLDEGKRRIYRASDARPRP